jgi:hypothetical protein
MHDQARLGVPEISYQTHCVQLATAVQALLNQPDDPEYRLLAQMMLDEYRTALARRDTPAPAATNVIPLHAVPLPEPPPLIGVAVQGDRGLELRPFSLNAAIDDLRTTTGPAASLLEDRGDGARREPF